MTADGTRLQAATSSRGPCVWAARAVEQVVDCAPRPPLAGRPPPTWVPSVKAVLTRRAPAGARSHGGRVEGDGMACSARERLFTSPGGKCVGAINCRVHIRLLRRHDLFMAYLLSISAQSTTRREGINGPASGAHPASGPNLARPAPRLPNVGCQLVQVRGCLPHGLGGGGHFGGCSYIGVGRQTENPSPISWRGPRCDASPIRRHQDYWLNFQQFFPYVAVMGVWGTVVGNLKKARLQPWREG